jgi:hypothetical protein
MKYTSKITKYLLILILLGGFLVRLYGFTNPIADWHSWRQAETSSVSRNFVLYGFDLLHPRMVNISNVQSGKDNPNGYFFVEFPIYNALQGAAFKFIGILTIEEWGRLISMAASVAAGYFLYLIIAKYVNKPTGLFAAFYYLFIPFDIYYGRTILADTSMVMAFLGGIYFFDKWVEEKSKTSAKGGSASGGKSHNVRYYLLSLLFTTLAFLLKPHALFFVLPIAYLAFKQFGWRTFITWQLWVYAIVSVLPLGAWRLWMAQYPEGIPANQWLFNGNGIRFRPAFFRWMVYERLTKLISGYFGVLLLVWGVVKVNKTKDWLFLSTFLISSLAYVCIIATGNVQHDYYQIPVMPSVAIFFAIGSFYLWQLTFKKLPIGKGLLVICVVGGFYFSWMQVRDYFNINNHSIVAAGKAVQRLTPQDAKIVANYNGDTSLLYQMDRFGWASFQDDMPVLIQKGADYLVLVNPTPQDMNFGKTYKLVEKTNQYVIFDLHKKP